MDEFRFAHPWALLLLPVGLWLLRGRWRTRPATLPYSDVRLMARLPVTWRMRLFSLPDILRALGWLLLVLALARPQMGQAREVIRGQGLDIVVVLDISSSMGAVDLQPNRLEAARQVIADFVAGREHDRIGVVLFARHAYHLVPLTLDYEVLTALLADIRLVTERVDSAGDQTSLDGTAAGTGIATAAAMMRESAARSKVIILLTDGATNAGIDPVLAAEAAATVGIRTYAVGMGMPEPADFADGDLDAVDGIFDEDTLARIAAAGGGSYFRAADSEGLRQIALEIDRLERSPVQRRMVIPWQDRAEMLLLAAVICLLAEQGLRVTILSAMP